MLSFGMPFAKVFTDHRSRHGVAFALLVMDFKE